MGLTGIALDVATVLIAGVILGITVDDTIHLYHGYLHRLQKGVSPVFAIIRSVESSGRAVIAISIILIAQFSLLALSDFRPTAHFGLLCAVGLLAGQVFELLLMPALLALRHKPSTADAG
jgi:predicted RND superfamily exporter protein